VAAATGLSVADVACPLGITRALPVAQKLRKATGAALENLEAFAVARAAAHANVPFTAILGVANHVGPEGHVQWRQYGDRAAAAACAAVRKWLLG
jgi:nucleoside phosphorylase